MIAGRFLQQVAEYYVSLGVEKLSGYTFVLPNKRSAMFLKRHFHDLLKGQAVMLPRFVTFGRLISQFADAPVGSRNELLFLLYDAMRRVYERAGAAERVGTFDAFVFWGDMMLSDFNDIDTSLVPAQALFKNLRDVKEIQADFLDEDQKAIVRSLWGESRLTRETSMLKDDDSDRFWLHIHDRNDDNLLSGCFRTLWDLEGEIYDEFNILLRERGLGTEGTQARQAWERVKDMVPEDIHWGTHYVFTGLSQPSKVQTLIMHRLKRIGAASFIWNSDGIRRILHEDNARAQKSLARLFKLEEEFPAPDSFKELISGREQSVRQIEIIACPSKIAQAKSVHTILKSWIKEKLIDSSNPLNTAIVLPDEGLLLPVLFSIPEEIKSINITMGLPYSSTTFATLFHSLLRMQRRAHKVRGEMMFFYEDVVSILEHPHIRAIAREEAEQLIKTIREGKIYNIHPLQIEAVNPALGRKLFRVVSGAEAPLVADYLLELIDWLSESLEETVPEGKDRSGLMELRLLDYFRQEVTEILGLALRHDVPMTDRSFFLLLERLMATRQIVVNGKPLQGLQIMGVLETRSLDFDNVILLSANEGALPRRQYSRTMIPNILRTGYGLPELNDKEGEYAYSFFRLVSSARRMKILYDSRTGVRKAGEPSRYVEQLRYLVPELGIKETTLNVEAHLGNERIIEVAKTPAILRMLDNFKAGKGNRSLSASALKKYHSCPLQFYLSTVRGLSAPEDISDAINAIEFGNIFHSVFQRLFEPFKEKEITGEILRKMAEDEEGLIQPTVADVIFELRHPAAFKAGKTRGEMDREEAVTFNAITQMVKDLLRQEENVFTSGSRKFIYVDGEHLVKGPWQISSDLAINFKMYIDRIDRQEDGSLRFIDFKTGSDNPKVKIDDMFDPESKTRTDAVFQLLTYCEAFHDMEGFDGAIEPLVYRTRKAQTDEALEPVSVDNNVITDYRDVSKLFRPRLEKMVGEIFDPEIPFRMTAVHTNCNFCPYMTLCGRKKVKF